MKKLFTTIVIGVTMLSLTAAKAGTKANFGSALNLKMFDNGIFSVVLDEQPSYSKSRVFSAADIQPGYHKLKVIQSFRNLYNHSTFFQVVYRGWINVPARSVVYAQINCRKEFDIMKVEPKFCPPAGGGCAGNEWSDGNYDTEYGDHDHFNPGNGHGDEHHGNGWGNAGHTIAPENPCISYESFVQLQNSIAARSFESSKLEVAKEALAYNYFTATQVATLTHLFTFESSKLEFAELAFGKTVDKQNYFLVNDAFTFENSISALNEYIARK